MTTPGSAASVCAVEWKMWLIRVTCVLSVTVVCAAQDGAPTVPSPTSAAPAVTTTKPPTPSLQLLSLWLDVFPSEKVEFRCVVAGSSDWSIIWRRNNEPVQESDPNVSLSADQSVLTITASNQIYSGSYSCNGQHKTNSISTPNSNPLQLSVYPNKPRPVVTKTPNFDKMYPGESVTFTCTVLESSGWESLWFHNGKEIHRSTSYMINSIAHANQGVYHCKVKRGNVLFVSEESSQLTLQVSDPPTPTMKLLTQWLDVFVDEVVAFSCEVGLSDWTFTWYLNETKIDIEDDSFVIDDEGALLNITDANKPHEGVYACQANLETRGVRSGLSNKATVSVYDEIPTPTLHKVPSFNPMYVGETVNMTCNVDVSTGWVYHLSKDEVDLSSTSKSNSIRLGPSDGGSYTCSATRSDTVSLSSKEMQLDVHEIPVPSLTQITPWLDVFPGEWVQLQCGMDSGSGWTYTWTRDRQEVRAGGVVSFDPNGASLLITSASAAYAGLYACKGHLGGRSVSSKSSAGLSLTVHDKKPSVTLTQDPDYKVMYLGESVSFTCHINVSSGWEYEWYKDGTKTENRKIIKNSSLSKADDGKYRCRTRRGAANVFYSEYSQTLHLQVKETKPKPLMTQQPDVQKVYVGESVSFECKVEESSGWTFQWYKNEAPLSINSSRLTFNASLSSNGDYKCRGIRGKTLSQTQYSDGRTLRVFGIPFPITKGKTPWLDVFPNEAVKLTCWMDGTSDWKYTWFRNNTKVVFDEEILSIKSASSSDRGQYSCSGTLKDRPVTSNNSSGITLNVYDTKPRVTVTRMPTYNVFHTGDQVSFSCHVNVSSGWEYRWYRNDNKKEVKSGNNYTITSSATSDSASYRCEVNRGGFKLGESEPLTISVKERPQARIILLTGWSEVFSTDSLVLQCSVEERNDTWNDTGNNTWNDTWNYTWFREGIQIHTSTSAKYIVTPKEDPEQSQYKCQGIRAQRRPTYSKKSEEFTTKNLLLKRRMLLSIAGCIVFGIVAVVFGFTVYRVFCKPAEDEDRPEEADLFVPMVQQKGADIPCPLVEYITDATLNAPSKDVNENGTICSETTPLPITQEDQVVTTESSDAAEENGGLASFKQ